MGDKGNLVKPKEDGLGGKLLGLREIGEKSQQVVADFCGISQIALSRYERGERMPGADVCRRMADYYGVSVDWLTEGF